MSWSSEDIESIKMAIKGGVLEVVYSDGRRVRYQSLAEMMKLLDRMAADNSVEAGNSAVRTSVVQHSRE